MWVETHRCSVVGCPSLASYDVLHYDFDLHEGAVVLEPDPGCPTLCVEHAIENELRAEGERRPGVVVGYPHTNQDRKPGYTLYRPLQAHYEDELRPGQGGAAPEPAVTTRR